MELLQRLLDRMTRTIDLLHYVSLRNYDNSTKRLSMPEFMARYG